MLSALNEEVSEENERLFLYAEYRKAMMMAKKNATDTIVQWIMVGVLRIYEKKLESLTRCDRFGHFGYDG